MNNVYLDRIGSVHNKEKSLVTLTEMCEEFLLTDVWRCQCEKIFVVQESPEIGC